MSTLLRPFLTTEVGIKDAVTRAFHHGGQAYDSEL